MALLPAITPGIGAPGFYIAGLAFAGLAVLVAILALTHQGERAFSASLVYLAMGIVAAVSVALLDAPWLHLVDDATVVERLSELAVVVALFGTGLRLDRHFILREWRSTALLLGVAMPLTIVAVAAFGVWAMGLSLGAAIVLGATLAPTDPVLAGDLGVAGPGEGDDSEPGFALTSEAGFNDGLAFPIVFLGLLVAGGVSTTGFAEWLAADVLYAIGGGILIGALTGRAIAAIAFRLRDRNLVAVELDGWAAVGTVLAIYGLAELAGTYGFLAAFAGGLAFRRLERDHEYNQGVHAGAEAVEKVLELAMILFVGSLLTLDGLRIAGGWSWLLAGALIVLIRPVAGALALMRSPLTHPERAYVGWFGVRGIGSIYYASAAVASGLLSAGEAERLIWTVMVVVAVSIVVHGISGSPLTRRLAAAAASPDPAAGSPRPP